MEGKKATKKDKKDCLMGFILFCLIPTFVMFTNADAIFNTGLNPITYIIAIIPLLCGIPLLAVVLDTDSEEDK